jgi:hypothetical protein
MGSEDFKSSQDPFARLVNKDRRQIDVAVDRFGVNVNVRKRGLRY